MNALPETRGLFARRACRSLGWGLAAFALLQVGLAAAIDGWRPVLRDPEFGHKLARLKARRRERPNDPLVLVIGSSRSAMGLKPDVVQDCSATAGRMPLLFNFGMTGYGPIQELALVERLLRAGVRPDRLLIEVHPLLLHQENGYGEESWLNVGCLEWGDVRTMRPYLSHPDAVATDWLRLAVAPWHSRRFLLMEHYLPRWSAPEWKQNAWSLLDPYGWLPYLRESVTEDEYAEGLARARKEYDGALSGYRISEAPDRAMRELLALCRRNSIEVSLFLMPESSGFLAYYPEGARRRIDEYLAGVCREYGCRCFDATHWSADEDFWDGHHLLPAGADRLSQRFAREVLPQLLPGGERPGESLARKQEEGPGVSSRATANRRR